MIAISRMIILSKNYHYSYNIFISINLNILSWVGSGMRVGRLAR